jgi:hypothetical protein
MEYKIAYKKNGVLIEHYPLCRAKLRAVLSYALSSADCEDARVYVGSAEVENIQEFLK